MSSCLLKDAWNRLLQMAICHIDWLWVAVLSIGHGYGADRLDACMEDCRARGKTGLCILSFERKKTIFVRSKILPAGDKGFKVAIKRTMGFQLVLVICRFAQQMRLFPEFKECARHLSYRGEGRCFLYHFIHSASVV